MIAQSLFHHREAAMLRRCNKTLRGGNTTGTQVPKKPAGTATRAIRTNPRRKRRKKMAEVLTVYLCTTQKGSRFTEAESRRLTKERYRWGLHEHTINDSARTLARAVGENALKHENVNEDKGQSKTSSYTTTSGGLMCTNCNNWDPGSIPGTGILSSHSHSHESDVPYYGAVNVLIDDTD